jgi:6-phosphofructo-2-kinase/fructose-2,6-biphosphatase
LKNLDELSSGIYDGLTYDHIKENYPEEHKQRSIDKLRYRYPRGESYIDLV